MYRAIVEITGIAPYSQSRKHDTPFLDGESHDAYEKRTWREKCNCNKDGILLVPQMALKQAMDAAAKRLAIPDPDNRRATLTKHFVSDVICEDHMPIGISKDAVPSVTISANSDGRRGSGKRVPRTFPQAPEWQGSTAFLVLEEKINPELLERVLKIAGRSIGVGQFRPENGGSNGRFEVKIKKVEKL